MKIEKNIPVPQIRKVRRSPGVGGQNRIYPFNEMEIGDSIFIVGQTTKGKACDCAHQYGRRRNIRFTGRATEGGVRIWRIK